MPLLRLNFFWFPQVKPFNYEHEKIFIAWFE